ncbi:hypothetical protein BDV96DRAFT_604140 [Lophiotrema nucula]|uniref:F-box domain-containing protein n=1 Tax=Lophiotrema nucula TaxID=690887 RepID=A0A6A5YSF9_9PLEO|nr:hypothetical protein BDV96DRAFT_604140 [Lophiotrema nucula]
MQSLETIPAELVNKVVKQLHPFDLTRLARVSKYFLSFARDALWGNIELHRNYSHSSWLDDPWPKIGPFLEKYHLYYNWYHGQEQGYAEQCDCLNSNGKDRKFEKTNAIFHRVIKQLFQKAGKGKRWSEIAPYVRHLCMTINHLSAPYIWDAILSLPNLQSIQLVGEFEQPEGDNGPPEFRAPKHKAAQSICKIRFRGYIPQDFVASVITGSARSITHLDLGALLPPKVFEKEEDDKEAGDVQSTGGSKLGQPIARQLRGTR